MRRSGGIPLKPIMVRALHMGDELHSRNTAASLLFTRELFPHMLEDVATDADGVAATVQALTEDNYFFLRLSMAAAKSIADAAHGIEGSSVVTAMAFNCNNFAIRVSGLGNGWVLGPHADVEAKLFEGHGEDEITWMGGESTIAETVGLGGFAQAAAFPLQKYQGGSAEAMVRRDWDFMSHGIYNTRYLNTYTEEQEREFYRDTINTLKKHTGKQLKGMLGPAISHTVRTPDLMAEAGLIYSTDWYHDDQPVPIKVKSGKLVSVPYSIELNDGILFHGDGIHYEGDYFARICKAQFDQLYREGSESGRVMCIALHPFLVGQPHRIRYLDEVLGYIMSHEGVWQTTADEIAEYYIANHYDQAVAHAAGLNAGH